MASMWKKQEIELTPIDWARLAAFIDGEGTISIRVSGGYPQLYIRIANTNPVLMQWLGEHFGGYVNPYRPKKQKANWKVAWVWDVAARKAEWVLLGCFPYLLLKRQQAEVGLAFRKTFSGRGWGSGKGRKENGTFMKGNTLDSKTVVERDQMRHRMLVLNKKGPNVAA